MKLLDEVINILSSQDGKLTDALIKTKVLLHEIGHKELAEWVNNELNGYPNKGSVPPYRVVDAQVRANMVSPGWQYTSHALPIGHLTEKQRKNLEEIEMTESLAVLEQLAATPKAALHRELAPELNGALGKSLASGVAITSAWCEFPVTSISSILIQVRSRLLDFLLELRSQLPKDATEAEAKQRGAGIDAAGLFSHAIFGDNATIQLGQGNTQIVTIKIEKGDFSALAAVLREQHVPETDIAELQTAVSKDAGAAEHERKEPGPSVKKWLKGMLGKAVDSTWKVQIAAAGNLLATAIREFYGWG